MLLRYFEWVGNLPVSKAIGESALIYPAVQSVHLVCLALLVGGILIVDLRLMGKGLMSQPVAKVARDARPWVIWGLVGLLVTGTPQLMQNAMKEYYSEFFWFKMQVLPIALIYHFTLRHKITMAAEGRVSPLVSKLTGLVSVVLWASVTVSSRFIGLFS